ncbi:MAG: M20/M25/M40 family metallo-hydrolase, partial [Alphaproteobacteria bacterium]|nr:M20/M25/M40 family metallo-hydrolase [Alphaproteobacteria bacterium]
MTIKPLTSIEILDKFIGFNTISRQSNMAMIEWIRDYLAQFNIDCELVYGHEHGGKYCANLWAQVGSGDGGIVLSGHSDVVPVAGQDWSSDPFIMRETDGRLYGRGTADMKGFLACALNALVRARQYKLNKPLQLAISYDEEIGCLGVHHLLHHLRAKAIKPSLCIIGEPTLLKIGIGHKGKLAFKVTRFSSNSKKVSLLSKSRVGLTPSSFPLRNLLSLT